MTDTPSVTQTTVHRASLGGSLRALAARRRRDDRGSTLVEAAFVMPIFILMVFGIFEFSGAVMAKTGTSAAVKAGARMAVVKGNDSMADRDILLRMAKEGAGIQQDHIDKVMIWHATGPDSPPPTSCTASNQCNEYLSPQTPNTGAFARANLPLAASGDTPTTGNADYYFGCDSVNDSANVGHKLDCAWEPWSRRIEEKSPTYTCVGASDPKCASTDWVGIDVEVTHDFYTGFFGKSTSTQATTVAAIEPQGYDN